MCRSSWRESREQVGACRSLRRSFLSDVFPSLTVALMNAPDVEPGYLSLAPPRLRETTPITVAGSVALEIPFLIPGRYAKHVQCPIYFAVCKNDSVAPAGPTRAYAKQAPKGVIKDYDVSS